MTLCCNCETRHGPFERRSIPTKPICKDTTACMERRKALDHKRYPKPQWDLTE